MGWATYAMQRLQAGEQVRIRPHGGSMRGKVNSGDEVLLRPCMTEELKVGDVVLVRVSGQIYLHLIKAMDQNRVLIGNNVGGTNGWTGRSKVYGVAIEIDGRRVKKPS